MKTTNICGIKFHNITKKELRDYLFDPHREDLEKLYIVTPNVDFIVRAEKDEIFKEIINEADLSLCDSAVIYKTSKFLKGKKLKDVITGFDVTSMLLERAELRKEKIYLLGSTEENVLAAAKAIDDKYKDLTVAGFSSGFFDIENDSPEIVKKINDSGANYLLIGMGSPRQELWSSKYKKDLNVSYIISIGGLFDIFSNKTKRAPKAFQKLGLEWFWRFICEPRRLWRRYFVEDMVYFKLLFKDFIQK